MTDIKTRLCSGCGGTIEPMRTCMCSNGNDTRPRLSKHEHYFDIGNYLVNLIGKCDINEYGTNDNMDTCGISEINETSEQLSIIVS